MKDFFELLLLISLLSETLEHFDIEYLVIKRTKKQPSDL